MLISEWFCFLLFDFGLHRTNKYWICGRFDRFFFEFGGCLYFLCIIHKSTNKIKETSENISFVCHASIVLFNISVLLSMKIIWQLFQPFVIESIIIRFLTDLHFMMKEVIYLMSILIKDYRMSYMCKLWTESNFGIFFWQQFFDVKRIYLNF